MMTLDKFRDLDTPEGDISQARKDFIAALILSQNPRLARGDDLSEPIGYFKNGLAQTKNIDYDKPVQMHTYQLEPRQLSGHPWILFDNDYFPVGNWLHMYEVLIQHPFQGFKCGDFIPVKFSSHHQVVDFKTQLTQEIIDSETTILIKFGVSKF